MWIWRKRKCKCPGGEWGGGRVWLVPSNSWVNPCEKANSARHKKTLIQFSVSMHFPFLSVYKTTKV